uniref:Spike glycoprotein n=1 Tax=Bird gammacoronavirus AnasCN24 TaxID=3237959 RepID=A0AB39AF63_9GAMC
MSALLILWATSLFVISDCFKSTTTFYYDTSLDRRADGVYIVDGAYKVVYYNDTYGACVGTTGGGPINYTAWFDGTTQAVFNRFEHSTDCFKPDARKADITFIVFNSISNVTFSMASGTGGRQHLSVVSSLFTTKFTQFCFAELGVVLRPFSIFVNGLVVYSSLENGDALGYSLMYGSQDNGKDWRCTVIYAMNITTALVQYQSGNAINYTACDVSDFTKLQCNLMQFNITPGAYPLTPQPAYDSHVVVQPAVEAATYYMQFAPNTTFSAAGHPAFYFNWTGLRDYQGLEASWASCKDFTIYPTWTNLRQGTGFKYFNVTISPVYGPGGPSAPSCSCYFIYCKRNQWGIAECGHRYSGGGRIFLCVEYEFGPNTYYLQATSSANNITVDTSGDVCYSYDIYGVKGYGVFTQAPAQVVAGNLGGGRMVASLSGGVSYVRVNLTRQSIITPTILKVDPCPTFSTDVLTFGSSVDGYYFPSVNITTAYSLNCTVLDTGSICARKPLRHKRSVDQSQCTGITLSNGYCFKPDHTFYKVNPVYVNYTEYSPLVFEGAPIEVPLTLQLAVTAEYIPTEFDMVSVDCERFVCSGAPRCLKLLQQYGGACSNIINSLNSVNDYTRVDVTDFYRSLPQHNFSMERVQGGFDTGLFLPQGGQKRSFIEDLLFTKVESVGLPTDNAYKECTKGFLGHLKDLACAQYYNGIMVLPPVIPPDTQMLYTTGLIGAMTFGGLTSAAAIPFATQVQARINHLGITSTILLDNQQKIAASFNNALNYTISGFSAVNSALSKIQDYVNNQAYVVNEAFKAIGSNFGAISNAINDIYDKLDELKADQQADRIITGRLAALVSLVSAKQLQQYQASQNRQLARQKISECVMSQSLRYGFCGNGTHVMSIPQSSPSGMTFLHVSYVPGEYVTLNATPGFCVNGTYAIAPRQGVGVFFKSDDFPDTLVTGYAITSRTLYQPRAIALSDVVNLTSCNVTFYNVSSDLINVDVDVDFNFTEEFDKWWNDTRVEFPNIDFNFSVPFLNISTEISQIRDAINGLNNSYIELQELSKLITYIKWPWYVWLAIGFATIVFILILGWIFFMTGCCGCCCGCFGLIPLMSRCNKKSSYYTTFDDDVVGEQIRPKKSV